jgi:hypothetical protein
MDLLGLLNAMQRHRLLVGVAVAVATLVAVSTAYQLPSMKPRSISVGAATSQILVDSNPSTLVAGAGTDQIAALGSRARVYAQYLSSRDAVAKLSRATGIPSPLITARGPFSEGTGIKNYQQQGGESRASDLTSEKKRYRLVFQAQEDVPIITVYATGASPDTALKLANASYTVLKQYVDKLERDGVVKSSEKAAAAADAASGSPTAKVTTPNYAIVVRQLGSPEGGLVGGGVSKVIMILAFLATLGFLGFFAACVLKVQEQRRALATEAHPPGAEFAGAAAMRADLAGHQAADAEEAQRTRWQRTGSLRG